MSITINTQRYQVNRHSDFELSMSVLKDGEAYAPSQFVMVFYIDDWDDCETMYKASLINGEFKNCSLNGNTITVYFDSPRFDLGTLKCRFYDKVINSSFADGSFDTCTPIVLPIDIVAGAGNMHNIDVGEVSVVGAGVEVDSELSSTSENPVQNKVITNALAGYYDREDVDAKLGFKADINGNPYNPFGALEFKLFSQGEAEELVKANATVDHQDESVTITFSDAYNYGNEKLSYTFDPIHQSTKHIATEEFVEDYVSEHGGDEQVQADWNESDTTDPAFIKNKPTIPDVPTNVSSFTNDAGYLTQHQDISGKVDKETGKGLSTNDYTTAEKNKLAGISAGAEVNVQPDWNQSNSSADDYIKNKPTIPTKVSDLTNDEGFITAEEVAGIVTGGDMAIVETSDYIDIFIYMAEVSITPAALSLYAAQKSATITVSGSHLKGDISISVPSGFTASPATIAHVGGVVEETNVTITYTGADASTASGSITATSVDTTASIPVAYTQYSGPTILADDSAISFKAGGGATNQQTLTVQGVNLEAGITSAISGTDAAKFSVSPASISQSGGTASGTLTITYSPAANDTGTHTATLTLSSSGATSKVITLNGAVSVITTSVDSLTMTAQKNSSTTATFTVEGSNLAGDLSIVASGTGLSVDTQTIQATDGAVAETTVTVTFAPTATGSVSGSITISDGNTSKNISVAATATGVQVKYNDNTDEDTYIEWEAGQIDSTTGADYMPSDTTKLRCRTKDYLPCAQSVAFNRNYGNAGVVFYDENKVYKGYHWFGSSSGTTDVPNGAVYFRAYINNANLADVAKQYTTGGPWLTDSRRTSGWGKGGIYTTYEP